MLKGKRSKSFGEYSKIRTAIREEPMKLPQYLRGEKELYENFLLDEGRRNANINDLSN